MGETAKVVRMETEDRDVRDKTEWRRHREKRHEMVEEEKGEAK